MAFSYGFYNSKNGDRRYDARQIGEMFDGLISDGVFATFGNHFMPRISDDGEGIVVGSGRAWFNHTWCKNDSDLYIPALISDAIGARYDILVFDINADINVRENSIKWVKGTSVVGNTPSVPDLIHTDTHNQYPICTVYRRPGVDNIFPEDIANNIGSSSTPFITGIIEHISAEEFIHNLEVSANEDIRAYLNEKKEEVINWYNDIKDLIDDDSLVEISEDINEIKETAMKKDGSNAEETLYFKDVKSFNIGQKNNNYYNLQSLINYNNLNSIDKVLDVINEMYRLYSVTSYTNIPGVDPIEHKLLGVNYVANKISGDGPSNIPIDLQLTYKFILGYPRSSDYIYGSSAYDIMRNSGVPYLRGYSNSNNNVAGVSSTSGSQTYNGISSMFPSIVFPFNSHWVLNADLKNGATYRIIPKLESLGYEDYINIRSGNNDIIKNCFNQDMMASIENGEEDIYDFKCYSTRAIRNIIDGNTYSYSDPNAEALYDTRYAGYQDDQNIWGTDKFGYGTFLVKNVKYSVKNGMPYIKYMDIEWRGPTVPNGKDMVFSYTSRTNDPYIGRANIQNIVYTDEFKKGLLFIQGGGTNSYSSNMILSMTIQGSSAMEMAFNDQVRYFQTLPMYSTVVSGDVSTITAASKYCESVGHLQYGYRTITENDAISNQNNNISIGYDTVLKGNNSIAIGTGLLSNSDGQLVLGNYNNIEKEFLKFPIIFGGGTGVTRNKRKTIAAINKNGNIFTNGAIYSQRGICRGKLVNTDGAPVFDLEDGAQYMLIINCRTKSNSAFRSFQQYWISAPFDPNGIGLTTTALAAPNVQNGVQNGTTGVGPFNQNLRQEYTAYNPNTGNEVTAYHAKLGIGSCTTDCWFQWSLIKVGGSVADFEEEWSDI